MAGMRKYATSLLGLLLAMLLAFTVAVPAQAVGTYKTPSTPKCVEHNYFNVYHTKNCDVRDAFKRLKSLADVAMKKPVYGTTSDYYRRNAAIPTMVAMVLGPATKVPKGANASVRGAALKNRSEVRTTLALIQPQGNGTWPEHVSNAQITCVRNVLLTAMKRYGERKEIFQIYTYLKNIRYGNEKILELMEKYEAADILRLTSDRITWVGPYLDIVENSEGVARFTGDQTLVTYTTYELGSNCSLYGL